MTLDDDLERLERRILGRPDVSAWLDGILTLRAMLATDAPGIEAAVRSLAAPALEGTLTVANLDALSTGITSAIDTLGLDPDVDVAKVEGKVKVPPTLLGNPVPGFDAVLALALTQAIELARIGTPPDAFLAPLFGAATKTRMAIADVVTTAGNRGVTDVARAARRPMVWVAERNACVRCLAHQGESVTPGEKFRAGLTYGPYTYDDAVKAPPLHPHCRCHLEILNAPEYAAALKREADRSVLRGFSLESESMRTRVYAADKLIADGVDAPKSVQAYARSAVKRGKFTTRTVGRGTPPRPAPSSNTPS